MGPWGHQRERTPLGPLKPPAVHRFNQRNKGKNKQKAGAMGMSLTATASATSAGGGGGSGGGGQSRAGKKSSGGLRSSRRPPGFERSPPRYLPGTRRVAGAKSAEPAAAGGDAELTLARTAPSLVGRRKRSQSPVSAHE